MTRRRPAKINIVSARFTNDELDLIKTKANELGITHTAYIQMMATSAGKLQLTTPMPTINPMQLLLHKELRQQGINLNQIARAINIAKLQGATVNNYITALNQIRDKNSELVQYAMVWKKHYDR